MVGKRNTDPEPIKQTVQRTLGEFWRTHSDTWHKIKPMFTEDQLYLITDLLISPSYYI